MKPSQKRTIDFFRTELCETLENTVDSLIIHFEKMNVFKLAEKQQLQSNSTNESKMMPLLNLISNKDHSWDALIGYLRKNDYKRLADRLEFSAKELADITCRDTNMAIERNEFRTKLATYYKAEHSYLPTMSVHHKHVSKVWVPLRIDDKTKHSQQQKAFDHVELLKRLMDPLSPHVAIVKGDAGIGKTTLVKKIAFDWATGTSECFHLILTMPLRYVGPTGDFVELAVQYYTNRLQLSESSTSNLVGWLKGLGRGLLICLDGLDEYGGLTPSPLATLFAAKFEESTKMSSSCQAPLFSYQLLITSRPYACEIRNRDFVALRFEISPLDESHLTDFIRLYCETDTGKTKVSQYVRDKITKKLVIAVPLILMFICYLADTKVEIPTNLNLLYEKLLENMVKREIERESLTEEINIKHWKESNVVKSTAKLAFHGCKTEKLEFPESVQNSLGISNDSFISGFVLRKFNYEEEKLNAEFCHRSIQEFFAALHCFQLISTGDKTERNSVMKECLKGDSQFGRFFFGVCSHEKMFDKMLEWLSPTFEDVEMISFDFCQLLLFLSASLSDCSEAEANLLGSRLPNSLDSLDKKIKAGSSRKIVLSFTTLSSLNNSFKSGLNLNFLGSDGNWSLSHIDPKKSQLAYVLGPLPLNLRKVIDTIQICVWKWGIPDMTSMISSVDRLPLVSTLIFQTFNVVSFVMNFDVNYEFIPPNTTSVVTHLRHFTFGFNEKDKSRLADLFSGLPDTQGLMFGENRKRSMDRAKDINWQEVTIRQSFKQKKLIKILIWKALEILFPEEKKKKNDCDLM